jgi:6-phosphogluconolactonase
MEPKIEVIISETPKKLAKSAARALILLVQNSGRNRFDIALSGGTTPRLLFRRLAKKYGNRVDWDRIHFWWGDERCVSPDSQESNYRMATDNFFSRVPVNPANIHRIRGEADPVAEAERYSEEMLSQLSIRSAWPVFDLVLLGMGEDGHTASVFPDRMELLNSDEICDVAIHPESGQKRITLTGQVINNANNIFFLVAGAGKAHVVSEIMNNRATAPHLPAYHISPVSGALIWFLDEEAANLI